jgi:hypothetical protein
VGWRRQFTLLLRRSWRQITRDRGAAIARLMSNLSSAIIFGEGGAVVVCLLFLGCLLFL